GQRGGVGRHELAGRGLRRRGGGEKDQGAGAKRRVPALMGEEGDEAMMYERFTTCRKLVTAVMLVFGASLLATAANAQQVVVIVNGEPITALDIEQRSKLNQLSTHKAPARQEILDELINEKLKVHEAKQLRLELP